MNSFNNQPRVAVFFSDLQTPQSGGNGIFVNANRVKRCVLRDGDVVSLASELELKFVDAAH